MYMALYSALACMPMGCVVNGWYGIGLAFRSRVRIRSVAAACLPWMGVSSGCGIIGVVIVQLKACLDVVVACSTRGATCVIDTFGAGKGRTGVLVAEV